MIYKILSKKFLYSIVSIILSANVFGGQFCNQGNEGYCTCGVQQIKGEIPWSGDAGTWYGNTTVDKGSEPKVGAIAVYPPTNNNSAGHVAVVSQVEPLTVIDMNGGKCGGISEGGKCVNTYGKFSEHLSTTAVTGYIYFNSGNVCPPTGVEWATSSPTCQNASPNPQPTPTQTPTITYKSDYVIYNGEKIVQEPQNITAGSEFIKVWEVSSGGVDLLPLNYRVESCRTPSLFTPTNQPVEKTSSGTYLFKVGMTAPSSIGENYEVWKVVDENGNVIYSRCEAKIPLSIKIKVIESSNPVPPPPVPVENQTSCTFSDVPAAHIANSDIQYLCEKGIVKGYPDGTFGLDKEITRAEFTKLVMATVYKSDYPKLDTWDGKASIEWGCEDNDFTVFADVNKTNWFCPFVRDANKKDIVTGYSDKTFLPNNPITKSEAAKIIAKAIIHAKAPLCHITAKLENCSKSMTEWFYCYVDFLSKTAIGDSLISKDNAGENLKRWEMATLMKRALDHINKSNGSSPEDGLTNYELCPG